MANRIQKLIYNLSVLSPMLIVFSVVWLLKNKSWSIPIVCCSIAIALAVSMLLFFFYGKKNLEKTEIRTSKISTNDKWLFVFIISYLIPIVSLLIKSDLALVIGIAAGVVSIILFAHVIDGIPNPILLLLGYHFYIVEAENGVSNYVVVSRRKIRNKQNLTVVKRVFEYLLVDTEV